MEYREDIEQLVKNTFDDFEADVHPDAWINIQSVLNVPPVANPGAVANNIAAGTKVTAVSSKFIIAVVTAIIGITATVVYFSYDNKTLEVNKSVETKVVQNALAEAELTEAEDKSFSDAGNIIKKEELAVLLGSSEEIVNNNNKRQPAGNNDPYYSSTNNDVTVAAIDRKNAVEVLEGANKNPDEKLQSKPDQAIPSIADNKKLKENTEEEDESSNQIPAEESKTTSPEMKDEKSIEDYLGQPPNVITPNNDGDNDVFVIEGKNLSNLKVSIIDRSGKIIHHWNNLHGFWDGKLENGQPAKAGTYFYNIFAQTDSGRPLTQHGALHLLLK